MNRAQIEAMLDKLAANNLAFNAEAVHRAGEAHTQLVMTMLIVQAVASALEKVLEVLAEQHGDTLGPWFDKVEHAAINDAKDSIASDATGDEAALVGKGVHAVTEVFAAFRARMQLRMREVKDK